MRYLSTYKIFENKEVDFIRQLFVDTIEELERFTNYYSEKFDIKVRPYDTHIHGRFYDKMPDVVLEITKNRALGGDFLYEEIFNLLITQVNQLENFNDVYLIGTDYEYVSHGPGFVEKGRKEFDSLLDMEQFKHYINSIDGKILRLRLYFRFEI